MKTITDYTAAAEADYDGHAYDEWEFRWSADAVAKRAATAGEIQRGNVRFLADRICAAHEVSEKARLAAAEAAANTPAAIAAREAKAAESRRIEAEKTARELARAEEERQREERRKFGAKLHSLCGCQSDWFFGCYSGQGKIVGTVGGKEITVAVLVEDYQSPDPDCNKYIAWGIPNEGTTTRYWESTPEADEVMSAYSESVARKISKMEAARAEEIKQRELERANRAARIAQDEADSLRAWQARCENKQARAREESPVPAQPARAVNSMADKFAAIGL